MRAMLRQTPPTAKGICFLSLEDETGNFNAILMPEVYRKFHLTLTSHRLLEIEGKLENRHGTRHLRTTDVRPLRIEEPANFGKGIRSIHGASRSD